MSVRTLSCFMASSMALLLSRALFRRSRASSSRPSVIRALGGTNPGPAFPEGVVQVVDHPKRLGQQSLTVLFLAKRKVITGNIRQRPRLMPRASFWFHSARPSPRPGPAVHPLWPDSQAQPDVPRSRPGPPLPRLLRAHRYCLQRPFPATGRPYPVPRPGHTCCRFPPEATPVFPGPSLPSLSRARDRAPQGPLFPARLQVPPRASSLSIQPF